MSLKRQVAQWEAWKQTNILCMAEILKWKEGQFHLQNSLAEATPKGNQNTFVSVLAPMANKEDLLIFFLILFLLSDFHNLSILLS